MFTVYLYEWNKITAENKTVTKEKFCNFYNVLDWIEKIYSEVDFKPVIKVFCYMPYFHSDKLLISINGGKIRRLDYIQVGKNTGIDISGCNYNISKMTDIRLNEIVKTFNIMDAV